MNKIVERLEEFMKVKQLNDNEITTKAHLSIGLIGKAKKSSRKGLHSEAIEKILSAYPELNPIWFITGKGKMFKNEDSDLLPDGSLELEIAKDEIISTQKEALSALKRENELLRKLIDKKLS